MLASIHPLGERARDRSWGVTVGAYLLGSTLAAALLGAALGGIGDALPLTPGATAAGVLAAGALALAADLGAFRLPTIHRQVDKDWLDRYRGWVVGVGFGFQLGLGGTWMGPGFALDQKFIQGIGAAVQLPAGATTVDLTGLTVMPAIVEEIEAVIGGLLIDWVTVTPELLVRFIGFVELAGALGGGRSGRGHAVKPPSTRSSCPETWGSVCDSLMRAGFDPRGRAPASPRPPATRRAPRGSRGE